MDGWERDKRTISNNIRSYRSGFVLCICKDCQLQVCENKSITLIILYENGRCCPSPVISGGWIYICVVSDCRIHMSLPHNTLSPSLTYSIYGLTALFWLSCYDCHRGLVKSLPATLVDIRNMDVNTYMILIICNIEHYLTLFFHAKVVRERKTSETKRAVCVRITNETHVKFKHLFFQSGWFLTAELNIIVLFVLRWC